MYSVDVIWQCFACLSPVLKTPILFEWRHVKKCYDSLVLAFGKKQIQCHETQPGRAVNYMPGLGGLKRVYFLCALAAGETCTRLARTVPGSILTRSAASCQLRTSSSAFVLGFTVAKGHFVFNERSIRKNRKPPLITKPTSKVNSEAERSRWLTNKHTREECLGNQSDQLSATKRWVTKRIASCV